MLLGVKTVFKALGAMSNETPGSLVGGDTAETGWGSTHPPIPPPTHPFLPPPSPPPSPPLGGARAVHPPKPKGPQSQGTTPRRCSPFPTPSATERPRNRFSWREGSRALPGGLGAFCTYAVGSGDSANSLERVFVHFCLHVYLCLCIPSTVPPPPLV